MSVTMAAALLLAGTYEETFARAARVMTHPPLSREEASLVATAYLYLRISGCGGLKGEPAPLDRDRYAFGTGVGIAASDGPTIWVNRRTGAAWAKGYRSVTDRREYENAARERRRPRTSL